MLTGWSEIDLTANDETHFGFLMQEFLSCPLMSPFYDSKFSALMKAPRCVSFRDGFLLLRNIISIKSSAPLDRRQGIMYSQEGKEPNFWLHRRSNFATTEIFTRKYSGITLRKTMFFQQNKTARFRLLFGIFSLWRQLQVLYSMRIQLRCTNVYYYLPSERVAKLFSAMRHCVLRNW